MNTNRMWDKTSDWYAHAACHDDPAFTLDVDQLLPGDIDHVERTCDSCPVIADCARTALSEKWNAVVAASYPLPDTSTRESRKELKRIRQDLERALPYLESQRPSSIV